MNFFPFFEGVRPNVQGSKHPDKWREYCLKEDSAPLVYGEDPSVLEPEKFRKFTRSGPKAEAAPPKVREPPRSKARTNAAAEFEHFSSLWSAGKKAEAIRAYPKSWTTFKNAFNAVTAFEIPQGGSKTYWIYGPPGTGKSSLATSYAPYFKKPNNNHWWTGYTGQPVVIIDEFSFGTFFKATPPVTADVLKTWFDPHAPGVTVQVHGAHTTLGKRTTFLTSNDTHFPEFAEDAFKRRISVFHVRDIWGYFGMVIGMLSVPGYVPLSTTPEYLAYVEPLMNMYTDFAEDPSDLHFVASENDLSESDPLAARALSILACVCSYLCEPFVS